MKKLLTLFAVLAMFAFASCEENGGDDVNPNDKTEQPEEKPDDAYITLNKEVVTFSPDGESVDIKVYSNYTWELTNNCDWVTTSITSGEASDEGVTVTLSADLSYDNREGTIIFSCGKAKKPLVVSQSLKEVLFADENNTFNIPTEGGNVIIAYQTTVECEVIIPEKAQSWISIAPTETRALVSESATLTVAENTTYSKRSAIVKVVAVGNKSLVAEYTITQDSKPLTFYIEYTSTDGKVVKPYNTYVFGANIVSNTYENGKGYIWFDAPITSIGEWAFGWCSSLASITIPDSVTSIGEDAFSGCSSLASATIGNGVTSIGDSAFYRCSSLKSIIIPNSVTSIGSYAFQYCSSLTSITIPDSVTSIGAGAFSDCSSLASVTIPDSVTSIGNSAFSGCLSLASITIPDSVTSIGNYAFNGCSSLTSITIPDSVTSIGDFTFEDCSSLASVTIGEGVTSIGFRAFHGCSSLASITIPDSVTSIGDFTFEDCSSLASITIPDSVTSIGNCAFDGCSSLTSVTIGNGVSSIGAYAFCGCSSLESVTIPDSVTLIESYAFYGCRSLAAVYCKPTTPPRGEDYMFVYSDTDTNIKPIGCKIYVPTESVDAYKTADGWSDYKNYIVGYDFE